MSELDPVEVVENSGLILVEGKWPTFHDAEIHHYSYWKGDIRSDEDVWRAPEIILDIELCALEDPFFVKLKFHGCCSIKMSADNPDNMMQDFMMKYEERGFYTSGKPLPPYIVVKLKETFGFHLQFKCFHIEVIDKYEEPRP